MSSLNINTDPSALSGKGELSLLDRRQACDLLRIKLTKLNELTTRGELPSLKIGRRRLYRAVDLVRWVESQVGLS